MFLAIVIPATILAMVAGMGLLLFGHSLMISVAAYVAVGVVASMAFAMLAYLLHREEES